jgi:hypothetical protein
MCLVTTWEKLLFNLLKGFFRPDNFVFLSLVSPVTNLLVGEVDELWVLVLKHLNHLGEVWPPNLFPGYSINHLPKFW